MSKFGGSNNKKEVPAVTSSSLSDIVFMLLFFFMVTTQLRDTENKVITDIPKVSEVVKLQDKEFAAFINVGRPTATYEAQFGTSPRIQLNDDFKTISEIRDFIAAKRESLQENQSKMIVNIKADKGTKMGIITDIKQELRRCSALKVMYSAKRPAAK